MAGRRSSTAPRSDSVSGLLGFLRNTFPAITNACDCYCCREETRKNPQTDIQQSTERISNQVARIKQRLIDKGISPRTFQELLKTRPIHNESESREQYHLPLTLLQESWIKRSNAYDDSDEEDDEDAWLALAVVGTLSSQIRRQRIAATTAETWKPKWLPSPEERVQFKKQARSRSRPHGWDAFCKWDMGFRLLSEGLRSENKDNGLPDRVLEWLARYSETARMISSEVSLVFDIRRLILRCGFKLDGSCAIPIQRGVHLPGTSLEFATSRRAVLGAVSSFVRKGIGMVLKLYVWIYCRIEYVVLRIVYSILFMTLTPDMSTSCLHMIKQKTGRDILRSNLQRKGSSGSSSSHADNDEILWEVREGQQGVAEIRRFWKRDYMERKRAEKENGNAKPQEGANKQNAKEMQQSKQEGNSVAVPLGQSRVETSAESLILNLTAKLLEKVRPHEVGGIVSGSVTRIVIARSYVVISTIISLASSGLDQSRLQSIQRRITNGGGIAAILFIAAFGILKLVSGDPNAVQHILQGKMVLAKPEDVLRYVERALGISVKNKDLFLKAALMSRPGNYNWLNKLETGYVGGSKEGRMLLTGGIPLGELIKRSQGFIQGAIKGENGDEMRMDSIPNSRWMQLVSDRSRAGMGELPFDMKAPVS